MRSPVSCVKNAVEEVEGRRWWDFTIGLRPIILVLSWRMERTWVLVMCEGMGVMARVSVEVLRTGLVCQKLRNSRYGYGGAYMTSWKLGLDVDQL